MKQGAKVRDALCALAREYDLVTVYAFGSRAAEIAARARGPDAGAGGSVRRGWTW